jgi:isoamylase
MELRTEVWPGRPYPLGATWDGRGVNFALFSEHAELVELCLFDPAGHHEVARIRMPEYTDQVWHGYLPDARPNLLYSYRVYGPYRPQDGHRFNPHKLLLDPYAKAIYGAVRWSDAHYGYRIGSPREDLSFDRRDSARVMPKCRVVDTAFTWNGDRRPDTAWSETIILELHARGMTMRHPGIDPARRGTFAGLTSPPMIDYLLLLGITAIELMPIQAFVDDRHLVQAGLTNYWGYNTIGFFAPDPRFLSDGFIAGFKTAVKRLHDAGIEVILDVVYNHTGEGNHLGPTLCFRGIDNASYYRLERDKRFYADYTGTGNTLNIDHPRVLQLVLDSLRYWACEMHVDGFRFDLCASLGRTRGEYCRDSPFFIAVLQDPVLSRLKLIAEPWDVAPGGFQLGRFPPGWAEWNAHYRDTVRRFWKGDPGVAAELASRLAGSSDIFGHNGRRPWASVNFITAHDGFTLVDVVSYNEKHNAANGEANHDGHNNNFSWNFGVEGPTNDPEIARQRDQQKRNLLATLLLSLGVPMLLAGDEIGRTQQGNNNAYCHDSELSWIDWEHIGAQDERLRDFVRFLVNLRRRHHVFSRPRYFRGETVSEAGLKDIMWLTPEGREATLEDWKDPAAVSLAYLLSGAAGDFRTLGGQRDVDESFLIMLNGGHSGLDFRIPELPMIMSWEQLVDTSSATGLASDARLFSPGEVFPLKARSFSLFVNRASAKRAPAVTGVIPGDEPPPTMLPVSLTGMPGTAGDPEGMRDEDETLS